MTEPIDPPEGEVEGPTEPVPGGQPEGEPQPWMPLPGTYGSRNAGRRQSILESFGQVVTRPILKEALEDADSEFQQALAAGRALVDEAQQHVDDALGAVANAGSIMDTIQGTGADVVAKHTEVLTLHGQAITAAAEAAGDAALAAAKSLEASGHAADALVLFEAQQQQIDAEQNARLDLHEQVIDAIRGVEGAGLVAHQGRLIKADTYSRSDNYLSVASGGTTQDVTALGTWTGTIYAEYGRNRGGSNDSFGAQKREWQVPNSSGGRTYTFPNFGQSSVSDFVYLDLDYAVNPGTQKSRDLSGGSFAVAQESWTTVSTHTWTVPSSATRVAAWFKAGWDAVPFLPTYRMRILVNGAEVAASSKGNWGPLIGNGYRAGTLTYSKGIAAGSTVTFQVWTNASIAHERVVRDTETRISWIEL